MNTNIDLNIILSTLTEAFDSQVETVAQWYGKDIPEIPTLEDPTLENLKKNILAQHSWNNRLWYVEDDARMVNVSDSVIANCKRTIDKCNQKRNDAIEKVDKCLMALLHPFLPEKTSGKYNTETPGMAIDRMSILSLKIFHMEKQTRRTDVSQEHIATCRKKMEILEAQRNGLKKSILELVTDFAEGTKTPTMYYQFKMYNDPNLNPKLYATGNNQ